MREDYNDEVTGVQIGDLVFLLQFHPWGRITATQARVFGHADRVAWLERATQRYMDDRQRQRNDTSTMQLPKVRVGGSPPEDFSLQELGKWSSQRHAC